jgi:hypothetical protein
MSFQENDFTTCWSLRWNRHDVAMSDKREDLKYFAASMRSLMPISRR